MPHSISLRIAACLLFATLLLPATVISAENWPCWRGPRGDGSSSEPAVVDWDATKDKNVVWKVALTVSGHAQPVIWEDRIFLAGCDEKQLPNESEKNAPANTKAGKPLKTGDRTLSCLDRRTGKNLWTKVVFHSPLESKHALNSYASSTPATDGKLVYVSFLEVDGRMIPAPNVGSPRDITPGKMVVAAYDFDGNEKWLVRPGDFISAHGYCASPVLFENLVIVNGDHDGDSYIVALDKLSGKVVWKRDRENGIRSYATPIIREIAGRTQLMFAGSKHVLSLDPHTGTPHWKVEGPTEQFVSSPVFDGKRLFITSGYPDYHVLAIRPDGRGDVTSTHIAWHDTKAKCYVPSPVVLNGYLIVPEDHGTVCCFEAETGNRLWRERMAPHYSNSLVTAGDLVYLVADDGVTKVIRPGAKLDVVAENLLGEASPSSPAVAHGQFFIRGEKHLFCFGKK